MGVYLRPFLLVASIAYIIHPSNSAYLPGCQPQNATTEPCLQTQETTSSPYRSNASDLCSEVVCQAGYYCKETLFYVVLGDRHYKAECVANETMLASETSTQPEDPCYTVDCDSGFYCRDGECRDRCEVSKCATPCCFAGQCIPCCDPLNDTSCAPGYRCSKGRCIDVCETPEYENKCAEDEVCEAGVCYSPCTDSDGCGDGYFCSNGHCSDLCIVTLCATNTTCVKGECVDLTTHSNSDNNRGCGEPGKQVSCDEKECPENYECYLEDSLCTFSTEQTPCQEAKCRPIVIIDCISGYVPEGNKCVPEQCVGYYCSPDEECNVTEASPPSPYCSRATTLGGFDGE